MTDVQQIKKAIMDAFGNATLTWTGLLQSVHSAHPDIKQVYGICNHYRERNTISVKTFRNKLVTVTLHRVQPED